MLSGKQSKFRWIVMLSLFLVLLGSMETIDQTIENLTKLGNWLVIAPML